MRVGRYEILRELGRGGMARVHLARQVELDRLVALKELLELQREDAEMVGRFVRESRLAGALNHESIVTVLDVFEHDGVRYIAMEYVPRGSLRPWVGRLEPAQLGGVLESVLAGLGHAHAAGVIHRDLKPENLMVNAEGRVKIADFGIARALADGGVTMFRTATGIAVGTPAYMAPEQAMAQAVGPWTDLYSVGVIAYELLSGSVPFNAGEPLAILLAHCRDEPPPLAARAPEVPSPIAGWVHGLLAKEPAQRPQSARAAWEELEEHLLEVVGPRWRRDARLEGDPGAPAPTGDRWTTVAGDEPPAPVPEAVDPEPFGPAPVPEPADPQVSAPAPVPEPADPQPSAPAPVPEPADAEPSAPAPVPEPVDPEPSAPERDPATRRLPAAAPPAATTPPPPAVTTRLPLEPPPAAPAAPRRRRRARLAVGAAAVVAVAVPVAVVLAGGGEDPRARAAPTSTPTATVSATPSPSPTATAEPTVTSTPSARPESRGRSAAVASPKRPDDLPLVLDADTDVPAAVGQWSPSEDATLEAAADAFGSDFVATSEPDTPYLCVVEWRAIGLTVDFANFGGHDPCAPDTGRADTIKIDGLASDRWRTLSGLRPGMPESAIAKLYKDARKTREGDWWLVTATSLIGDRGKYAPIAAIVDDDVVSGFELSVGAAGD